MSELGSREIPMVAAAAAVGAGHAEQVGDRSWLANTFEREMEDGRGFLWLPVCLGTGILVYFALPTEPSSTATTAAAVVTALLAWASRDRVGLTRLAIAVAFVAAGAAAMKVRTDLVLAPKLPREMTAVVNGWVAQRETAARSGVRVLLRVATIERLAPSETPYAVRITVRARSEAISVGDAIAVTARIRPPNGPVMPGGYDFARAAFYERIGGVGFAYGAARPADIGAAPFDIRIGEPLERLREAIGKRVTAALPSDRGRVATTLITGDRGGISEGTQEAMRASGLGHILAISGLHMALVAGAAFWIIRALLALSPNLTLRHPIKKWTAAGALVVATVYLGISGGQVATQRAYIMLAIMLLAIMVDRRAITLRNVGLAAFVVLIISPESLLSASFQMSFAATIALVAAYEEFTAWSNRRPQLSDRRAYGIIDKLWRYAIGLFVTSLVAGLATTPFGIYHFQRMAPLTLIANLLAMPVLGLVVMPMAFLAVLLMPVGIEWLPLWLMSWGLGWIIDVAEWTAGLTGHSGSVPMAPAMALIVLAAGFLWLALWRQPWRLLGLVPITLAVPITALALRPDILVSADGVTAAVRGSDGRLSVVAGSGSRFVVENWLRADADPRDARADELSRGIICDPLGCIARIDEETTVSVVLRPDAFAEDCHLADIVVSRFPAPANCEALAIDRGRLMHYGSHALYRLGDDDGGGPRFRIVTAYPTVQRPWMPAFNSAE
jgi:competence protein ComEC